MQEFRILRIAFTSALFSPCLSRCLTTYYLLYWPFAGEYVIVAIHTQTIEGFWSIFKRGVVGTFHKMSRKYMQLYVAEFQFRYNNRENADIFGTAIKGC